MEKEKKPIYKKWWFWVIVIFIVVGVGSAGSSNNTNNTISTSSSTDTNTVNKSTPEPKAEEILEIDYNTLHKEYMDNPINADSKYKGKTLKLTGIIDNIDREIAGNPYVTFHVGDKYSFQDIRLTFKKSEEEKVTQLKKEQTITVKGICRGTLLSSTVSLDNCELIEY